ncbi:MAG: hypothetical protein ABI039_03980, partial [Vicinamibacterales bacterium]
MTLKLAMLAAGATLGSVASFAADDASTASRETITVSPEAAADAVDVAEKAKVKPNELGKHIDYQIEMHEGTNVAAFPSPDGSMIVISLQGGLWMLPARGGVATKITPFSIEATQPAWSPDGQWIAFQNYSAEANYAIWIVKPNGKGLQELTSGPFDDREPSWFPDSRRIVFSSDRSNDKQYKIWTVDTSGALKQITTGTGAESNPVVSLDGKTIAFVNSATIFTIPAAGGVAPTSVGAGNYPSWTPDGSKLVYQSAAGNLNVNGADATSGEDLFPFPVTYMTNGRFMYTSSGKIRTRNASGGDMQVVEFSATDTFRRPVIKAKQDRKVLDDAAQRVVKGINMPVISPDGQSVAFVALNDLYVMKIGQTPTRLTHETDRVVDPRWTADGKAIYFSSDKGNAGSLAMDRIDLATKVRTRVAVIPGTSIIQPTLSPTEDRIAFTTGAGMAEIIELATTTRTPLVANIGANAQVSRPFWSPDGTRIMVVDNDRINSRFREGYNKLRVIDIATKTATFYGVGPTPEAVSDREEGAAVWSPDGTKVAFIGDSVLKILPVRTDGSPAGPAVAITNHSSDMPSWAADSQTLLYMNNGQLKKIRVDGTHVENVPLHLTYKPMLGKGTTVIHAGKLWNGLSETLQEDVDIIIKGSRITGIQPHSAGASRRATHVVDASNLTVIPGMWDPHFHPMNVYQGSQFNQVWAAMFGYGFTSVQSVAGAVYPSTEIREALEAGNLVGPRLFTSSQLLEGSRLSYSMARYVRTPEVADLECSKFKAVDIDWIKSYVRAPIPVMNRLARCAQDIGVPTATHLLYPGVSTGIQGLSHLQATQRMGYGFGKSPAGIAYQDVSAILGGAEMHLMETLGGLRLVAGSDILINNERFDVLIPAPYVTNVLAQVPPTPAQLATLKIATDDDARAIAAGALFALGTDVPLN